MKVIVSETKWLYIVKQEAKRDWNSSQTLMDFYYEIQHKAHLYTFMLEDGKAQFPKYKGDRA